LQNGLRCLRIIPFRVFRVFCGLGSPEILHQHQVAAFQVKLWIQDPAAVRRDSEIIGPRVLDRSDGLDLSCSKAKEMNGMALARTWLRNEVNPILGNIEIAPKYRAQYLTFLATLTGNFLDAPVVIPFHVVDKFTIGRLKRHKTALSGDLCGLSTGSRHLPYLVTPSPVRIKVDRFAIS